LSPKPVRIRECHTSKLASIEPSNTVFSALEVIFYNEMRYINLRFTYLLTYLFKY